MSSGINLSKEFFELLKAIGESKSKQEEDRIIAKEVQTLKKKLEAPPPSVHGPSPQNKLLTSKKRAKEFLVRLLYVEMLGHDGSFGYIKAVELAASASLFHKRTGYVVCGACLSPDNEFRFMLVNQMQRDLQSSNVLECSGGILACTQIITSDMVPAVSTEVSKLLEHDSATIRKKAIICLHRCHQLAPDMVTVQELQDHLRKVLCDKDPSVMGSSLNVIEALATEKSNEDTGDNQADTITVFKELVPSLVSILKQVGDHRLTADYEYHRVPAPWIQIKLVRILGVLGRADAQISSGMYEILSECMSKADTGINAGYAVVYECIKTIVSIYPNPKLLDAAAESIARFIESRSHNLKYLGVTGLSLIVEQHPQYAAQHQMAVMDCLEDQDETLQRKTLDLLYRMTNPVNVEFITEKLVEFIRHTTDLFLKKVLTVRVCSVAERYAPNNAWYVATITKLFEVSGDMVSLDVAQNLMSLIAEGTGDDEEADTLLRQNAVEIYVRLLQEKTSSLPKILLETMAWCLGEYGYLSTSSSLEDILHKLCALARTHQGDELQATSRKFLLSAIMKLTAQLGTCPPEAAAVIDTYTKSADMDLQQRCLEFQNLLTNCPQILPDILPVDASTEDVEVDVNLSFLESYVQTALANGTCSAYEKPEDDDDDDDMEYGGGYAGGSSAFNMTPYEKPQEPSSQAMMNMAGQGSGNQRMVAPSGVSLPPGAMPNTGASGIQTKLSNDSGDGSGEIGLNTRNVANVWGKGGLTSPQQQQATAPAASAPAPAATPKPSGFNAWGSPPAAAPAASHHAAPAPAPVKTAEQLEKERKAAALFGGIVPGAAPPPPAAAAPSPVAAVVAATAPAPKPAAAPEAAPVVAPPVAAAASPEVDLLDMSAWDAPAPAPVAAAPDTDFGAAPVAVETISSDDGVEDVTPQQPTAAPAAAAPPDDDPFAGAGLLDDVGGDKPLANLMSSVTFEYNGSPMAPLQIVTAQYGQQWGKLPAASPLSIQSPKVSTLDQFMDTCVSIGLHPVEAISATNEGICAGMLNGGAQVVLAHGKVTPGGVAGSKVDVTVKGTDTNLTGSLAMYLQTMLR